MFRSSVEEHTSRPVLADFRGHVDPLMTDLKKKADAIFKDPDPRSSPAPIFTLTSSAPCSQQTRLKLDLQTYSGDILDWRESSLPELIGKQTSQIIKK